MEDLGCTEASSDKLNSENVNYKHSPTQEFQRDEPSTKGVEDKELRDEIELGREFDSYDSAHQWYVEYGKRVGFDVRIHLKMRNTKGIVRRVTYCCSKEGFLKPNESKSYSQPVTRVGCKAHITCQLQKNGNFQIVSSNASHNHDLVRTPMKHMMKINRSMSKAQKAHGDDADYSGVSIKETIELMSREVGGRENLGFLDKDYKNYIYRKRKMNMEKGDANAIVQYFQKMQTEDSSYFHTMQLDEDGMITNIFWADPRSVSDYGLFGDVVCFDTTYRTNEYGRPFAPFIGVNHHKQTIIFGAALLYDETTSSFKWLFETFLAAMSGKHPKTILTDQSAAMAKAISEVFPETRHRLCVWHIYQNGAKNLSSVFQASKEFASDFGKLVYEFEEEDEWLLAWNNMLETYNLKNNKWLASLFELRAKWALMYGRHTFTADMMTTQRSESMNNVLKKYLKSKYDLLRFFIHYERLLADRRYKELIADFKMLQTSPMLIVEVEILQHARDMYTPKAFQLFQNEYTRSLNYKVYKVGKKEETSEYKVSYMGKCREHAVLFNASTQRVSCTCMMFTFVGILCRHVLKVLDKKNVSKIPTEYILKRWTRSAKGRTITNYHVPSDNHKESIGKRYGHLCRSFREVASVGAEDAKLTAYANERSIELLTNLEKMKKELFKDKKCIEEAPKVEDSSSESETEDLMIPRGVKRKAIVGRPRGDRIKNVAEKFKKKTTATKRLSMKNTSPIRLNLETQVQIVEEDVTAPIIPDILTQESQVLAACDTYDETPHL
ncbi:protein FAR1-RELATED SEQUENCE 5-like [Argentina anserina]|uniref:protein FAR1-RELATED SEQUENCE 5-like n=1 Tax=Argentina anserina TaxID=57926 RepID=UPI00217645CF|nr:protein FAR1-RELATED SEQUENCE 5-like [Potentilla anserina]